MCKEKLEVEVPTRKLKKRVSASQHKRIWEVSPNLHCMIIGTCLSLRELGVIAKKARIQFKRETSDYEIHGTFVNLVGEQNRISKLVDKTLDKKYQRTVARFRRLDSTEKLAVKWDEAFKSGDISGVVWAVTTHPLLSDELQKKVYGDVHMLSHLLGASRRLDIRKLQKLDASCATLEHKLARTKAVYRKRLKNRDREIGESLAHLSALKDVERRLALANDKLLQMRRDNGVGRLEQRIIELAAICEGERTRANHAEAALAEANKTAEREGMMTANALERIRELSEENAALEQTLRSALVCCTDEKECGNIIENEGVNLCGRKIMYVGGRSNLVRFYRELVERRGGEFIYHDGGIENSMEMLKRSVTGADAVICPVDCVSHSACQSVKQVCKHMAKPFIPLRSSGLSSLAYGMQAIV